MLPASFNPFFPEDYSSTTVNSLKCLHTTLTSLRLEHLPIYIEQEKYSRLVLFGAKAVGQILR